MGKNKDQHVVGFDLGGTKMMAVVFDEDDDRRGKSRVKTPAAQGGEAIFERMVETIEEACKDADVKPKHLEGIGVGCPGPLDFATGTIVHTPNMGFENFPLRERLEQAFEVPVFVDNDVNVGTYGEFCFGAGRGTRHMIGLFPGTGLGGGLVLNGQVFRGATGAAGELGHMIVQVDGPRCGCGQHGCVEALSSRLAVAKEVAAAAMRGEAPTVAEAVGTEVARIKSKVLAKAWKAGEAPVVDAIRRSARFLGIGMANAVNVLSPERVVLGGGLVEALGDAYVELAAASMREHAMTYLVADVDVRAAELGDYATVMGAARLLRESRA